MIHAVNRLIGVVVSHQPADAVDLVRGKSAVFLQQGACYRRALHLLIVTGIRMIFFHGQGDADVVEQGGGFQRFQHVFLQGLATGDDAAQIVNLEKMLDEIEAGKVGVVLTKDLSRLGRNSALTGLYTNFTFPQNGVRYIAVNDNYDTADPTSINNDFAGIKNWFKL